MTPKIRCLVTSFLLLTVAGCSALTQREADLFQRGQDAFQNEHWSVALESAMAVLESRPDYAPAKLLRGKALFHLGKFDVGLEALEEVAANVDPIDAPTLSFEAKYFAGRCLVEQGRQRLPEMELATVESTSPKRREARDFFVSGNLSFLNALKIRPNDYDALLWRGYCIFRLENHRKAVDLFRECERHSPGRWEHNYFAGLAMEGLYKTNTQSLSAYMEIVGSGARLEHQPVYEHLVVLHPRVSAESGQQIFDVAGRFSKEFPAVSPAVEEFLVRTRSIRAHEEQLAKLRELSERVHDMVSREQFASAVQTIETYLQKVEGDEELKKPLAEVKEEWSLLLEASAESLAHVQGRKDLTVVATCYEWSRRLTTKIERLVVLQQKINAAQQALSRQRASERIEKTLALLKEKKYDQVLQTLADTSVEGLSERDVDLYNYLHGTANYNLGRWKTAANSFRKVTRRDLENVDMFHGLALVKAGQESAGMTFLASLQPEARTEDVNRILAHYFLQQSDFSEAARYFALLERPQPDDSSSHFEARRNLGMHYYREGEYPNAAKEFELACQLLETQVQRQVPEVYLYLGNSYYRLAETDRAKKVYQDLSNSGLTATQRKKCRDLFLYRGQIYLEQKRQDLAYRDFAEFLRLGGELSGELKDAYGRLVATYASFVPLDSIEHWNYVSTTMDYNYTLSVSKKETGAYRILRREGGTKVTEETWWRQGIHLTKEIGDSVFKLPVNLQPTETRVPVIEYTSRGLECTSEIVEIDQTVEIPGRGTFAHCIKVRSRQKSQTSGGTVRTTTHVFYFAPEVGEIKQEIYRDDVKVSEIVLSEYSRRDALLGN